MVKSNENITTRHINIKNVIDPFLGIREGGCDCCEQLFHITYILDKIPIYHCIECFNYDLCDKCFENKKESLDHKNDHKMEKWLFVNPNNPVEK